MKLLKPEFPTQKAFESEEEYDAWKQGMEQRKNAEDTRALELLRGIPSKRYEPIEAKAWRGGFLHGPPGVGKTREAIARLLSTPRGIFYEAWEYIEDSRAREFDRTAEAQDRRLAEALRCPHLVLDDLGARRPTPYAPDAILRLLQVRWREKLETLVTSNLRPEDIAEQWDPRIASRIADFGAAERLEGRDRRGDR